MYPIDRDAFRQVLNELALTFSKDLSPELEGLYFEALKDVPLSAVQAMALKARRNGRYFPKPADLRPREDQSPGPAIRAYADDGWHGDPWDQAANLHFMRYIRARIGKNPAFFGVRDTPDWARRVLRFCGWKAAWARDMREWEGSPTGEQQKTAWTEIMRRAEAELRQELPV